MTEFRLRRGAVQPQTSEAAISALSRAPLAEEPFFLAGLRNLVRENPAAAERLLLEARRRNPRSRPARLLLLNEYLRTGRAAEAASEITMLARLIPQAYDVLAEELVKYAGDPKTAPALRRAIAADPRMREAVLQRLAQQQADPDLILRLAGEVRLPRGAQPPAWQQTLMETLVNKGDHRQALALWTRFAGVSSEARKAGVYDGRFEGLPGSPPFNWKLTASNAGVAERGKNPALQVEYYGRLDGEFASQLLLLPPGRHRLSFRAEGDASGKASKLVWRVTCHGGKAPLLELPLVNISYARRVVAGEFTVPAGGCGAQWLGLYGVAAEFPDQQNATITDVKIQKAGQAS